MHVEATIYSTIGGHGVETVEHRGRDHESRRSGCYHPIIERQQKHCLNRGHSNVMDSMGFVLGTGMAIGIGALLIMRWARSSPQALLLLMPLAYDMVYVNASVLYLDTHEIFITETSTVSQPTNAALRLVLFHALIVGGVWLGFEAWSALFGRLGVTVAPPSVDQCRRVLWLMVLIIAIALLNVLLSSGVPYPGSGFDRQSFWQSRIRIPIIRDLFGILLFFVPFACAAVEWYGRRLGEKRLITPARIVLAFYFLYLLIGGQVFHGLLFPATVVAALLLAEKVHTRADLRLGRWLPVLLAGGAAMVVTVYLSFERRILSQSFASPWDAIVYRIVALSGSTYWQTDYLWTLDGATGSLDTLLEGREFLIQSIMPPNLAANYLRDGVNLQGALPGTSLLSLGLWPTVVVCLAYGVLLGLVTSLVYAMVVGGRIFLLFPAAYLWLWTVSAYSRGSLEPIVNIKFIMFVLIVAGASLLSISARRSRGPLAESFLTGSAKKIYAPSQVPRGRIGRGSR